MNRPAMHGVRRVQPGRSSANFRRNPNPQQAMLKLQQSELSRTHC